MAQTGASARSVQAGIAKMISKQELRLIARSRLRDAQVRFGSQVRRPKSRRGALRKSAGLNWNPEKRYQPVGRLTPQQAVDMVTSARRLLEIL